MSDTPTPPGTPSPPAAHERLGDNPFYVLGLRPGSSRTEVEREGQKLLAMLELGLSKAERYPTPLGERDRTADKVRLAMAELRDPDKRLLHELWARLAPEPLPLGDGAATGEGEERVRPWPEARVALGWGRR